MDKSPPRGRSPSRPSPEIELTDMRVRSGSNSPKRELSPMPTVKKGPKFAQDYARIHTLMSSKDLFLSHLGGLEKSMSDGVRMKDALYKTEQQHGFAPKIHRLNGLENDGEFMGMLKDGVMFKDRGAAHDHGESAHRLQWHVVAKDMEANPQHYTATHAVQLYQGLADRYVQNKPFKHNWKSLFDENTTTHDFRQPETLTSHLREQTTMPNLQAVSVREATKRQKMGGLDKRTKGTDRDSYIEAMRSMGMDKPVFAELHTGGTYTPRVRVENEQPKTQSYAFEPIVREGK